MANCLLLKNNMINTNKAICATQNDLNASESKEDLDVEEAMILFHGHGKKYG